MYDAFFFLTVVTTLFALVNPIAAVPIMAGLTEGFSSLERKRVIKKAIMVQGGMLFGFMLLGEYVFTVLGINISDFKIAGGVLLFKVSLDMLQGRATNTKLTRTEQEDYIEREAVGIVPIGVPLLAGPGSITTAIIYFNSKSSGILDKSYVGLAVLVIMLISLTTLSLSTSILDRMGRAGSLVISRIMGLLIAAVGIEFIVSGISGIVAGMAL